jgi:putative membrane protein
MKRVFGYGIAVLAISAAPVLAQTSAGGGSTSTGRPATGSTAGTNGAGSPTQSGSTGSQSGSSGSQSGSTGSQSGSRSGSQSGTEAAGHSSSQESARSSNADHQFVMEAARGGMAEVELGQLASQKAQSDQVKQFAQRMVQDHGKANDELKSLAQQKNITLPTDLDSKHKATHDRLSKLSGAQFDRAYMQDMLQDHRKDVNDFRKESQSGKDPDVKAWAAKTLPTLEEHLRLAQSTSGAVGTSGSKSSATSGSTGRTGDTSSQGSSGRTGTSSGSSGSSSGSGTSSGSGATGSSSGTPGSGSSGSSGSGSSSGSGGATSPR